MHVHLVLHVLYNRTINIFVSPTITKNPIWTYYTMYVALL